MNKPKNTNSTDKWAAREASRLMAEMDEFERAIIDGIPIKLDTGRLVEMRLIELTRFVENGEVPNPLLPLVYQELYGDLEDPKSLEERHKNHMDRLRVMRWVADNVLKKPVEKLFNSELTQIYNLANNPAKALERFRLQQASDVGTGENVREVGANTEPAPQN